MRPTSAPCSRSSPNAPPTAWSPVTACTRAARTASGRCLLGLYGEDGTLASVGVIGAFPMERRKELFDEMQPLVTTFDDHPWAWAKQEEGTRTPRNAEGSRWAAGKDLSFTPLRPDLVVEVRYDHMEGVRFRHTAQFVRWRPGPRSALVHLRAARGAGELRPRRRADRRRPGLATARRVAAAIVRPSTR